MRGKKNILSFKRKVEEKIKKYFINSIISVLYIIPIFYFLKKTENSKNITNLVLFLYFTVTLSKIYSIYMQKYLVSSTILAKNREFPFTSFNP